MVQRNSGTVVLGLGNDIMTDDAVGLRVASVIEHLIADDPIANVTVLMSTRAGFELIDLLSGFDRAIIIDAFDAPHPTPGCVRTLSLADVSGSARLTGGHEISLAQAFALAEQLGAPMPAQVEIYAIEACDLRTISEKLTPAVAKAVMPLACEIHSQLKQADQAATASVNGIVEEKPRAYYPPTGTV